MNKKIELYHFFSKLKGEFSSQLNSKIQTCYDCMTAGGNVHWHKSLFGGILHPIVSTSQQQTL